MRAFALSLLLQLFAVTAFAQTEDEPGEEMVEADAPKLDRASAQALLAQALPEGQPERIALLQQQAGAARTLEDRPRQIAVLAELFKLSAGRPEMERWIRPYLSAEFSWGRQAQARAAGEAVMADKRYSPLARTGAALRLAWYAAQGSDRAIALRTASLAEGMAREQISLLGADSPRGLAIEVERLQVHAESERWRGNFDAATASLREAVRAGGRMLAAAPASDPALRQEAQALTDGSLGMLCYALVRAGRAPEAIAIADGYVAQARAGRLGNGQDARWFYRQAHALVAAQRYVAGLAAARESDAMLASAGASLASHTRLLAQLEQLNALMGLKRWAEADALYQSYLAAVSDDALAKDRASDWRLRVLLAAENGRSEEALKEVERIHRFRGRIYGEDHPQTQEAAGVRGLVKLIRGDLGGALKDYEQLFVAVLDVPGGWLDLELRGARGFALGVAFDQFLEVVAQRALARQALEPRMIERALQLADRQRLSSTQRALVDSAARLRASTPQLAALLEEEQRIRRLHAERAGGLSELLGEEDRRRKEMAGEAFKSLPDAERKAAAAALRDLRERIKQGQVGVSEARAELTAQRERITKAFPAYGDLVMPPTPTAAQLRGLLGPDEALLLVHSLEDATLVWLIAPGRDEPAFHVQPFGEAQLAARVGAVRRMLDLSQGVAPKLDEAELQALYRELMGPLPLDFTRTPSLIVASSGALASLPLAALVTEPGGGHWLLRKAAVSQLPAASSLQSLRRLAPPREADKPLIGFGDPAFKAASSSTVGSTSRGLGAASTRYDAAWGFRYADIPPLPDTRNELQALARQLGGGDLRFGAQATRAAVLAAPLLENRVVAFATHGLMPGELPGISKPALAMAATGAEGESPLLELDDVLGLKLNAQWVLLSACNTAAGEQGGAAMTGLVRGFFFAGARSVLATHWAVDSAAAAALVPVALAPGLPRAQALRQAQLALADGKLGQGRWVHPYFWAGYALFGDPKK
ncbi:MAG: CHAT domain-containing protein [Paucibacter sp.]|nr:CHAT domain-containing protein [Roseateles sp.]